MGRVTEALRRAGLDSRATARPEADETHEGLEFFSGGGVVSVPWEIDAPHAERIRSDELQRTPARDPVLPEETELGDIRLSLASAVAEKVVVSESVDVTTREQYRRLAAQLHQLQLERSSKVVMITSALPQEGKTLTLINLALTLSESLERRVLAVDADLRHPMLHEAFSLPSSPGLSAGLSQRWEAVLRNVRPRLAVLPAGRAVNDPMSALTSDAMRRMLEEARGAFDWILLDTPPVGFLPDANLLASMVDLALVVVVAARTPWHLVQRTIGELGRERVFGVLLNKAESSSAYDGYAAYHRGDRKG